MIIIDTGILALMLFDIVSLSMGLIVLGLYLGVVGIGMD